MPREVSKGRTNKKVQEKSVKGGFNLDLVIDSKLHEKDEGIFYLLPSEMSKSGLLNPEKFDSCTIQNVNVDDIRPSALLGILSSLKANGRVTVVICEPIAVMQPYEARMIEANARLAGFVDIQTASGTFFNEYSGQNDETLVVTFVKPEKVNF